MTRTIVFDQGALDRDPLLAALAAVLKRMAALQYDNRLMMPYTLVVRHGSREYAALYESRMYSLWVHYGWLYADDRKLGHGSTADRAWQPLEARKYHRDGLPERRQRISELGYRGMLSEALRYALRYIDWIWLGRPELRAEAESALVLGDLT
jgi:hypothetical protein